MLWDLDFPEQIIGFVVEFWMCHHNQTRILVCCSVTGYAVPHMSWGMHAQEQWDVGASAEPIEWM